MKTRLSKSIVGALAAALLVAAAGCASAPHGGAAVDPSVEPRATLGERWGVEVVALRTTAADTMLDFRYRVLDADKAAELLSRENKPQLIDQKSGLSLGVPNPPKVGPLRQSSRGGAPQEGRTYFILFGNSQRVVRKGDLVTVVIGDFEARDLVVQ